MVILFSVSKFDLYARYTRVSLHLMNTVVYIDNILPKYCACKKPWIYLIFYFYTDVPIVYENCFN